MDTVQENVIEFAKGSKVASVTLSTVRYIKRVKKLAEKFPDEFKIVAENEDGSIVAHIPVQAVKINYTKRPDASFGEDDDEEWIEIG